MSRIFGISDLHTDYEENLVFVEEFTEQPEDVVLVAGDVSDSIPRLIESLKILQRKYKEVFFIPGNHELWLTKNDHAPNSLVKLFEIIQCCNDLGVRTDPGKVRCVDGSDVWVVPLYSWYAGPEDDPRNTLYTPGAQGPSWTEQSLKEMGWSDAWFCKWPSLKRRASGSAASLASLFADMNAERLNKTYDAPVITFSHFMPRPELMKATSHDEMEITLERNLMEYAIFNKHINKLPPEVPKG
eukprot:sb/3469006/